MGLHPQDTRHHTPTRLSRDTCGHAARALTLLGVSRGLVLQALLRPRERSFLHLSGPGSQIPGRGTQHSPWPCQAGVDTVSLSK